MRCGKLVTKQSLLKSLETTVTRATFHLFVVGKEPTQTEDYTQNQMDFGINLAVERKRVCGITLISV